MQQIVVKLPQDKRCQNGDVLRRIEESHQSQKPIEQRRPQTAHIQRSPVVIIARRLPACLHDQRRELARVYGQLGCIPEAPLSAPNPFRFTPLSGSRLPSRILPYSPWRLTPAKGIQRFTWTLYAKPSFMTLTIVQSDLAPRVYGPYSQAIIADRIVYTAGQLPLDPETMELVPGAITEQATQVLANLRAVLQGAGSDLNQVVKTTLFLVDLADFEALNQVYARAFGDHRPARSTVQVAALPRGARVEIDAIAVK